MQKSGKDNKEWATRGARAKQTGRTRVSAALYDVNFVAYAGQATGSILRLLADAEFADHFAIAVGVVRLQVVKKTATLGDKHQ